MMKLSFLLLAIIPMATTAFSTPTAFGIGRKTSSSCTSSLPMVTTGPKGKPAKTHEEDLELTRQVINEFLGDEGETPPEGEPKKESKKDKKAVAEEA